MAEPVRARYAAWPPSVRRALRISGFALALLLLLPALQVLWARFVNPSATMPMAFRRVQSGLYGLKAAPAQYSWRDYADLPRDFLRQAWITEDGRFYIHRGFDWKQIRAALEEAKRTGRPARGASTITQQCARSLFLWQSRSWLRKGLEAYYTFWMETFLPKRRILELYANVVELGDGVYGVDAAARHYYAIPAGQLTKERCALFVAMLPQPRQVSPLFPAPGLKKRQAAILARYRRTFSPEVKTASHADEADCQLCDEIVSRCSESIRKWFAHERTQDPALHASAGYRGKEEQEEAFRRGASKAQFGQSPHNYFPSRAVDVWFNERGRAVWDSLKLQEMAERLPAELEWGGYWKELVDAPHFQEREWKTVVTNFPDGNQL